MSEPIGRFEEVFETEEGLFVKALLPIEDSLVHGRVIPQMKIGSVATMSIGFSVLESRTEKVDDKTITVLTKIKLWEISLVTIPANPGAVVTAIKSVVPFQDLPLAKKDDGEIDFDRAWNSGQAIGRVRSFTNSVDSPSAEYKQAFLWYDRENADEFTAYKLPIADVIDNTLTAIPRGIFSAAAALSGARGGVDIPDSDRTGVIANVSRYYDKMGLDSPFEKGFKSTIESLNHIKSLSGFLKDFGLSNLETNVMVSKLKNATRDEISSRNDELVSVKNSEVLLSEVEELKNFTKEKLSCQKQLTTKQSKKSVQPSLTLESSLMKLKTIEKDLKTSSIN